MINIVIPMAGLGNRFLQAGYGNPKPFIDVNGKPMIARVMENLKYDDAKYILIGRKEHLNNHKELVERLEKEYNAIFIGIEKVTEGAACTALYARKYINTNDPLLIANSDQIVDITISTFIDDCFSRKLDGSILTFIDPYKDKKWSFAKLDENELVSEVREKEPISDYATVGIYLFVQGKEFVDSTIDMIINNDRVNNEFYVCPVYNYLIRSGKRIGIYNVNFQAMHGIGTPDDLKKYMSLIKI